MAKVILVAFAIAFVAVAVQGAAVPSGLEEPGKAARAACIAETGANEDAIDKTATGEFPDDDKLKCYFKCTLEKFQLIKDDNIDFDAIQEMLPEPLKEKGLKTKETCLDTSDKDLCQKAYNFHKCIYKLDPLDYFVL